MQLASNQKYKIKVLFTDKCKYYSISDNGDPIRIFGADHQSLEAVSADIITDHGVYLKHLFIYLFI